MWRRYRLQEQNRDGRGQGKSFRASGGAGNDARLKAIEGIGEEADGVRANQLQDVDGERVVGKFQDGEMDESPAAVARRQREQEDEAAEAARELADREAEAERLEREEAERLQAEGAGDDEQRRERPAARTGEGEDEAADEKVVAGVRYYRTIVSGQERWLTMKQLREAAGASANAEETLQRAQEALASASHAQLTPKADQAEELDDQALENVILSANMGDEEAVRKLVSVIKGKSPGVSPQEITRLVTQQIATQREVDRAETAQAELLGNEILEPIFRQRLGDFARAQPKTRIVDAYKAVGDALRKDFAAMLKPGSAPPSKIDRKRTIVAPPASAGRQPARQDDEREVPVSEQIDQIAKGRGQLRAHRIRRS